MLLTQFYATTVCSPTRAMLMSGTDDHLAGLGNMAEELRANQQGHPGYKGHLSKRVAALPEVLGDAGYHTFMTGKWHLGETEETSPAARGFDRSFALVQGGGTELPLFSGIKRTPKWLGFSGTIVAMKQPLKNASMRQVLDSVVRNASFPISYVAEDYGIVFEPADRSLQANPDAASSAGWQPVKNLSRTRSRLDSVIIPEIAYGSLIVDEVIADLIDGAHG
tara:strand:- start:2520 stop:3185 length:666 start_codon:yes stop_codon:yes gene_type:complete